MKGKNKYKKALRRHERDEAEAIQENNWALLKKTLLTISEALTRMEASRVRDRITLDTLAVNCREIIKAGVGATESARYKKLQQTHSALVEENRKLRESMLPGAVLS